MRTLCDSAASDQPRQEIVITLPDGSEKKGMSWQTSPMDIAKEISKGLAERVVIAKVNGELWDLERPLEGSVNLELLDFEHPDGLNASLFLSSFRSCLPSTQANVCSGIHRPTSSANQRRSTMGAICASALPRMKVSSTRWPSRGVRSRTPTTLPSKNFLKVPSRRNKSSNEL